MIHRVPLHVRQPLSRRADELVRIWALTQRGRARARPAAPATIAARGGDGGDDDDDAAAAGARAALSLRLLMRSPSVDVLVHVLAFALGEEFLVAP